MTSRPTVDPAGVSEERLRELRSYFANKGIVQNTPRPTIAELEKLLSQDDSTLKVEILPSGEVRATSGAELADAVAVIDELLAARQQIASLNDKYSDLYVESRQQLAEMRGVVNQASLDVDQVGGDRIAGEPLARIRTTTYNALVNVLAPTSQPSRGKRETLSQRMAARGIKARSPTNFHDDDAQPSLSKCPQCGWFDGTHSPECAQPEQSKSVAKRIAAQTGEPYPFEEPEWHGADPSQQPGIPAMMKLMGVDDAPYNMRTSPPQDDIVASEQSGKHSIPFTYWSDESLRKRMGYAAIIDKDGMNVFRGAEHIATYKNNHADDDIATLQVSPPTRRRSLLDVIRRALAALGERGK